MALSFPERFSNVNEKTKLLVFFLVYTAVGEAGFLFFTPEIGLTTFWPSCGVLAGMLLIVSPRSWAPYLVAAVASSIISSVVHAISFPLSCAIISTRTLEACLAAMIIRSTRGGGPEEAENSRNVLTLIIASVVSSGVVSFLVVLAEAGFSPASRWSLWPIWWTGDAVAIMAIAPAFVFSGKLSLSTPRRGRILVIGESVALFITAGIVAWFGFLAQIPLFVNARAFLVLPVLWAALRRPPLYTAMVGILLVMCAMWGIAQHPDPAAGGDAVLALSMLSHLGLFTILIGFGLYVSVVVCEKNARESRLTESERQNHLLADNASEMVVRFAPDGKVTFVSPASNRILGYDSRQLSEDGFLKSLVHPEDLPVVVAAADAVTSLHEPAVFRVRVRKPDASYCWTETTVCAVRHNESGVVSEIHAVTRDVTIQRAAESELAKLNRALQTTIECNQILVRAGSEDDLLHGVGNIIVDQGHYPLIWVALLDGDCVKEVLLNSSPAHKEVLTGDVRTIWTETLLGNGPAGLALSNGE